jgi:hypothetical protein
MKYGTSDPVCPEWCVYSICSTLPPPILFHQKTESFLYGIPSFLGKHGLVRSKYLPSLNLLHLKYVRGAWRSRGNCYFFWFWVESLVGWECWSFTFTLKVSSLPKITPWDCEKY